MDGSRRKKYQIFFQFRKKKSRKKLVINGATNENPKDLSNFVSQFYSKLYSSLNQPTNTDVFLSNLSDDINKITTDFRYLCDKDLNIQEVIDCINIKEKRFAFS